MVAYHKRNARRLESLRILPRLARRDPRARLVLDRALPAVLRLRTGFGSCCIFAEAARITEDAILFQLILGDVPSCGPPAHVRLPEQDGGILVWGTVGDGLRISGVGDRRG